MIVFSAALIGALLGGVTAKKRGGKLADIAQYAAVYAIGFAIVGMLATIMIHRASL
ncbi:apolipoprotein acyltransferase [Antarcticimicrobium sediminis]|uniref:Apolipoprotein acyltransferase n=1 Tax=Antarcticimicrobium sediminis TaxID=2546227 RepID=A0A4R5F0R1_9RHOB|nr:apolipoprotein acyltransferase [Antarcticimicrobium sediminis]TDE40720.1 apolipoprotein acyltransferase [Antarcticimicrobium sediminis]